MFKSAAKTHIGHVRSCNEDSYIENPELGLWLVADGVGGNAHGDFASQVVSQTVERRIRQGSPLKEAIEDAHRTVIKLGKDKPDINGMASTVVAIHFKGSRYQICWVGDSRAYLISEHGGIQQLTTDHNQAQFLVDTGEITQEEARLHPTQRVLMHAVGINDEQWKVDQIEGDLGVNEKILLCSDGLSGELDDANIKKSFEQGNPLAAVADELVGKALEKGGTDNITLALIALDRHGVRASNSVDSDATNRAEAIPQDAAHLAIKYLVLGIVAALVVASIAVWVV
ncbi:PP2C family protein-serine/threonine phosphatase [Alkalimarinus coralli]|uniref:PP2C family protein-serine/threonine phosphatase n=1 Tax=Alkalimarinus coralli TaxID=2935863 RepID=UPI00202B82BB|nr:protein phosphatase 2C domain-containing protein [Alkalimarinus coralli]